MDIHVAQKIYIDHNCNYELMKNDNSIDEYNKYNVSKELELKWQELYKDDLIKNMHMSLNNKAEFAEKLAKITNETNDFDSLIAIFNETKELYKINDSANVIEMCQIIPNAISPKMLSDNYSEVRGIVIDVMDMLEVLLRKDMVNTEKQKDIRASLDIEGIKKVMKKHE